MMTRRMTNALVLVALGMSLSLIALVLAAPLASAESAGRHAAAVRPTTQRAWMAAHARIAVADLDGDAIDEFVVWENSSLFVTSSDFLAIGKAYSRAPFDGYANKQQAPQIAAVLSGAFLGASQPAVLCAFTSIAASSSSAATQASTNVTCSILQPKQFRLQWIVPSQSLPFSLLLGTSPASESASAAAAAVELFVADLDGDGIDELVSYDPSSGSLQRWMLREAATLGASAFQFEPDPVQTVIPVIDALPASSLAPQLKNQQLYAGRLVDCACPLSSPSALPARCTLATRNRTMLLPPQDTAFSIAPITLRPPANLTAEPAVSFELESSAPNRMPSDDILLLDPESGRIQLLSSCVGPDGSLTLQRLLSQPVWLPPGARLSLAAIRGVDENLDLVVTPAPALAGSTAGVGVGAAARIKFFRVAWTGSVPARVEYLFCNQGDLARLYRKLRKQGGAAAEALEVAWMRIEKPRVIAPESDPLVNVRIVERITFVNGSVANASAASTAAAASEAASGWTSVVHPSPESSSFLRHDAVLWNGARALLHFVAATFVSTMPRDRVAAPAQRSNQQQQQGEQTISAKYASVDVNSPDSSSLAAAAVHSARGWLGERSFVFSFSQRALSDLGADHDGDALLTRHELGFNMDAIAPLGFVSNASLSDVVKGVRFEPLSALGCSPFRKDVLVEVDYMSDGAKSMRPFEGFDQPAREDFAEHGIALHVHVDDEESIPRVGNLGAKGFSWDEHIWPLKARYFNPIHRGFFHYCLFLDSFGGGSVSGQSVSVPANDFFVSLGGWAGGHGSLQQQAGTFLHELGHNMNLLHGGNDGANWKINHLSVMNYQYQVVGVRRDGAPRMMLSDFDCGSIDENELDESLGIHCQIGAASKGHSFSTMIRGKYHTINQPIDFNGNGDIETDVAFNVTGSTRQVFTATPNEFARMRFDGLNTGLYDWARMKSPYAGDEQRSQATGAIDVQQGEEQQEMQAHSEAQHVHLHELSYEEATALEAGLSLPLLMRLPFHGLIQRALHWLHA